MVKVRMLLCCFETAMLISTGLEEREVPTQLVTCIGSGGTNKGDIDLFWLKTNARLAYLNELDSHSTAQAPGENAINELKGSLTACETLQAAVDLITDAVAEKLAKAMMIPREEIDLQRPVSSYGVDSLVAAEMRNWFFRDLKADVNVLELLSGVPITGLAAIIAERSKLVPERVEK